MREAVPWGAGPLVARVGGEGRPRVAAGTGEAVLGHQGGRGCEGCDRGAGGGGQGYGGGAPGGGGGDAVACGQWRQKGPFGKATCQLLPMRRRVWHRVWHTYREEKVHECSGL